jgi:hypothetical protein
MITSQIVLLNLWIQSFMILDAAPLLFCEKEQYAPYLLHFEAVWGSLFG